MTASDRDQLDSLAVAQEVDALCDRFEAALRQGAVGPLDDWLPVAGPARAAALIELTKLEREHRLHAAKAHPVVPALPLKIGRYRVIKQLGPSSVYQCHDSQLDRPVAVKVMRRGDDPSLAERFHREARIAAGLTHPQLCPIYDVGESGGLHYLTMPLLVGETLADYLQREGPLPEKAAAQLTALLARAIHEAHQAGVLHGALKPANVMLTERRQPIVLDCGLSTYRDAQSLAYCAPELRAGDTDAGGPAADVYSLGVLLYEMLTGHLPTEGQAPATPASPLHRVCRTALAQDPKRRYVSMEAFAEALEECAQTPEPTGADRRVRLLLSVVALLAMVTAGALALAAWSILSQVAR